MARDLTTKYYKLGFDNAVTGISITDLRPGNQQLNNITLFKDGEVDLEGMFGSDDAGLGVWIHPVPVIKSKTVAIKIKNGSV